MQSNSKTRSSGTETLDDSYVAKALTTSWNSSWRSLARSNTAQ